MENVAIAPVAGQSVADGSSTTGTNGADKSGEGLFGLLVSAEVQKTGSYNKSSQKTTQANATDPTMALLMAAMLQGFNLTNLAAAQDTSAGSQGQTASAVQETAPSDAAPASQTLAQLVSTVQEQNGQDNLAQLLSTLQGQNGQDNLEQILSALQGQSGQGNLAQLLSQNPQGNARLSKMLQTAPLAGQGIGSNDTTAALAGTTQQNGSFNDLLAAMGVGSNSVSSADSIKNLTAAAGSAATNGNAQALEQIKQLFEDIISGDTTVSAADASAATINQDDDSQGKDAAIPQEGIQALTKYIAMVLGGSDTTDKVQATVNAGSSAGGEAFPPGTLATIGQSKTESPAIAPLASEAKPAEAERKKPPVDFSAAMKSYQGQTVKTTGTDITNTKTAVAAKAATQAFDNIVDTITSMKTSAAKEMEISLKPDFLGKVVIKLSMDEGGLVAKIAASNPKVQDAFLNQASTLQNALSEQGLKDVRIIVTSTSAQEAALQQQSENRGQGQREQAKRSRVVVNNITEAGNNPALQAYETVYRTGTINYLA